MGITDESIHVRHAILTPDSSPLFRVPAPMAIPMDLATGNPSAITI